MNEDQMNDILMGTPQDPKQQEQQPEQQPEPQQSAEQPAPEQQTPQQPSPETMQMMQSLQQMQQELQELRSASAPQQQMDEQEQAIAQLKEQLGFNDLQSELQQRNQQLEQMQRMMHGQQVKAGIENLQAKYQDFNPDAVAKELQAIAREDPSMAAALDNPRGWEMIYTSKFASNQPQQQPDNIVGPSTSGSNQDDPVVSRYRKLKDGGGSDDEIGELLASLL